MSRRLLVVVACLALLAHVECKRSSWGRGGGSKSTSSRNRGSSTSGTASQTSGGFFGSWFSSSSTKTASGGSVAPKKDAGTSSYGWSNPSNSKPAQTNGWTGTGTQAKPAQTNGWSNPAYSPGNTAPKPGQTNGPAVKPGQTYGWSNPSQAKAPGTVNNQFQAKPNAPPSSNIGPGGYPVQSGGNYGGSNNWNNRGNTYNTGYSHQPAYNPGYHGNSWGHSAPSYTQQSFTSNHGFTSNNYPSHNSFGYPGQGMFGNSNYKYGGMGLFGGGSGSYGYPGSGSSWGYPSYGSGRSSSGSMLKGLAVGAVGGYLASSLISRISNPWGYRGSGYGQGYGYERHYHYHYGDATSTTTRAPPAEDQWIHCVAFDPKTNSTLINPNCSCTVTTSTDPMTNLPISSHYCTTNTGVVIPQPQMPFQLPPGVNNPNASPTYLNNYNQGYGGGGQYVAPNETQTQQVGVNDPNASPTYVNNYSAGQAYGGTGPYLAENSSLVPPVSTSESPPEQQKQVGGEAMHQQRMEFYTKLEKIVNMGQFSP